MSYSVVTTIVEESTGKLINICCICTTDSKELAYGQALKFMDECCDDDGAVITPSELLDTGCVFRVKHPKSRDLLESIYILDVVND